MSRKLKVQVSEVKTIGFKPLKTETVMIQSEISYKQFLTSIKQRFATFDHKKYVVFLPQLTGASIIRDTFSQFIQNVAEGNKAYADVHIQRTVLDRDIDVLLSSSDEDDEMQLMGFAFDDKKAQSGEHQAIMRIQLPGDPTDSSIKLIKEDCPILRGLNVIRPAVVPKATITEMKEQISKGIIYQLTKC